MCTCMVGDSEGSTPWMGGVQGGKLGIVSTVTEVSGKKTGRRH